MKAALFITIFAALLIVKSSAVEKNSTKEVLIELTKERIGDEKLQARYLHFLNNYPFSKRADNASDFVTIPKRKSINRSWFTDFLCYASMVCGICRAAGSCGAKKPTPAPTPEPIIKINNTIKTYDRSSCVCSCQAKCSQPECPELPPRKDVCAVYPACDSHCDLVIEPLEGPFRAANSSTIKQIKEEKKDKKLVAPYRGIDKLKRILQESFSIYGKVDNFVGMLQPDMKLLHNIDQKLVDDIKYVITYHKDRIPINFPELIDRRFDWRDKDAKHLGSFITGSLSVFGHLFDQLLRESSRRRRETHPKWDAACKCNINCTVKAGHCTLNCENKSNCNKSACVC